MSEVLVDGFYEVCGTSLFFGFGISTFIVGSCNYIVVCSLYINFKLMLVVKLLKQNRGFEIDVAVTVLDVSLILKGEIIAVCTGTLVSSVYFSVYIFFPNKMFICEWYLLL